MGRDEDLQPRASNWPRRRQKKLQATKWLRTHERHPDPPNMVERPHPHPGADAPTHPWKTDKPEAFPIYAGPRGTPRDTQSHPKTPTPAQGPPRTLGKPKPPATQINPGNPGTPGESQGLLRDNAHLLQTPTRAASQGHATRIGHLKETAKGSEKKKPEE